VPDVPRDIEVLWLGAAYGARLDLVRGLRARGFDVRTRGPGWPEGPAPFREMIELYARAHVVLGMSGVGHYDSIKTLKGRDFEVPMAGGLYLTSYNPELADQFELGREVLCYAGLPDCADTLHWLRRRPDVAAQIRAAARARALRDHTWDARIARVLQLLGLRA
jgi:spore maturation protein CgeB